MQFKTHGIQGALLGGGRGTARQGRTRRQRFGGCRCSGGEQLAVLAVVRLHPRGQFGMGTGDPRLGLAQLSFQSRIGLTRGRSRYLIVQGGRQLHTASNPAIGDDRGVSAQLITHQFHGLTHIGGEKAFDLHGIGPQFCPTVATMVTCLLSGISWYASTCIFGTASRAKRESIARTGPATNKMAGLPSISWRCAASTRERCSFSAMPGSRRMPSSEP